MRIDDVLPVLLKHASNAQIALLVHSAFCTGLAVATGDPGAARKASELIRDLKPEDLERRLTRATSGPSIRIGGITESDAASNTERHESFRDALRRSR
jgi:hypothetical protein